MKTVEKFRKLCSRPPANRSLVYGAFTRLTQATRGGAPTFVSPAANQNYFRPISFFAMLRFTLSFSVALLMDSWKKPGESVVRDVENTNIPSRIPASGRDPGILVFSTPLITEQKTKKKNILMINRKVFRSLERYLKEINPDDDDYLFSSRKGGAPLTIQSVNRLIKSWTSQINLKGRYGAHTLHKTWGYICKRYLHVNQTVTKHYLGIQEKEIDEILLHEI